jgi:glutathione S-transferase
MRARLALFSSGIQCELREVRLSNKPPEMLALSSKGTVPVLHLADGTVIDESLDIMFWALEKNDPGDLLNFFYKYENSNKILLDIIDDKFKFALDRYKYPNRYDNINPEDYRYICQSLLVEINDSFGKYNFISGNELSFTDMAILPFIRQFRIADKLWFDNIMPLENIKKWLSNFLSLSVFNKIMLKYPEWDINRGVSYFPKKDEDL